MFFFFVEKRLYNNIYIHKQKRSITNNVYVSARQTTAIRMFRTKTR